MSSSNQKKTVRITREEAQQISGKTDWARVDAASDATIAEWQNSEGIVDQDIDAATVRVVVPQTDVRSLRQQLGLSREEFALRYRLSLRTVQHWEQQNREPDGPARVLLWLISKNPNAVASELASF